MKAQLLAVLATTAVSLASTAARGAAPAKPNILFFFADDWARIASCYADPQRPSPSDVVKTPNIDRVAQTGVRFNNAFYSCPQCTPSRGSIVTGSYFWRCGSAAFLSGGEWRENHNPFDDLPRFPHLLAEAGYATAKAFKTLQFTPTLPEKRGEYLRYGLHVSAGKTAEERETRRQQIIAQTRASIRRVLTESPAEKPFFFVFGPINTHRPYARGSGKALWGIEPDSLKGRLPAFLPDVPEVREDMADSLGEIQALDLMVGIFVEELRQAGKLDHTLIVLTGDNGLPGFPRGKTQLYDLGSAAPLIVSWPDRVKGGRTVDDFINLMDLAPTFLDVAAIKPPASMDARSFLPQLLAEKSGVVDASRDHAIFGRERHYISARPGNLPFPARAIRTADFLYIRNFKPDRWPLGDPYGLTEQTNPSFEELMNYASLEAAPFRDLDSSPSKAWIISHRGEPANAKFYEYGFARVPAEQLYDVQRDPDQLRNLAADPAYAGAKDRLSAQLMRVLRDTHDPRLDDTFDRPPYIEKSGAPAARRGARKKAR